MADVFGILYMLLATLARCSPTTTFHCVIASLREVI